MATSSGKVKEEGLVKRSLEVKAEARALFDFMERSFKNPETKGVSVPPTPMLKPLDEINNNLSDIVTTLNDIRDLFIREFVERI